MRRCKLFVLFFLGFWLTTGAQNQARIDSLKMQLEKYDAHKSEMGVVKATLADTAKVKLLERLWGNYLNFDNELAKTYALEMIVLSEKIGYKKGIADGYVRLGIVNDEKGNYEEAIGNNQKAILIQEDDKDTIGLASSYINLGVIFSKISNFPEALKYLELGAKYAQLQKDDYGYAVALSNIGIVYKLQMKYPEALHYYEKSKAVFQNINETEGVMTCLSNIGGIYVLQNKLAEAVSILKNTILIKTENISLKADALSTLVKAYIKEQDYDSALFYLNTAFEIYKEMKNKYGLALSYTQRAEVYQKKNQIKAAIGYAKTGLAIADEIGEIEFSKNAHKLLSELFQSESNYKEAFYHQVLYKQFNDSIFNTEKDKKFTEYKMMFHFEKVQDSLVTEHNKEVAIKEFEIAQQKKVSNYSIVALAFIISLLSVALYQRNKLAAIKRQQALQSERTRISQDLHDDLGTGLTGIMMMSEQIQFKKDHELMEKNIDKIKQTSRLMVEQMADIVWAMNADNDTLESLVSYLQNYVYSFYDDQNVKLIVNSPESVTDSKLNGLFRRNVFLVVKETLSNTYKYAQAQQVTFEIKLNDKEVIILISDDGKGFDLNEVRRFGNGLKNMKNRMDAINGKYNITASPGMGTTTTIQFNCT